MLCKNRVSISNVFSILTAVNFTWQKLISHFYSTYLSDGICAQSREISE